MTTTTTATKPKRIQQLRLITTMSPVEKKRTEKLAKETTNGDVGALVRQLVRTAHISHLAAKKKLKEKAAKAKAKATAKKLVTKTKAAKSTTTKRSAKKGLVGSSHVAPAKPARKRATSNAAANGTKSGASKRVVSSKSSRKSTSSAPKKR